MKQNNKKKELKKDIINNRDKYSPLEIMVLNSLYGLDIKIKFTYEEIGNVLKISTGHCQVLENKAIETIKNKINNLETFRKLNYENTK